MTHPIVTYMDIIVVELALNIESRDFKLIEYKERERHIFIKVKLNKSMFIEAKLNKAKKHFNNDLNRFKNALLDWRKSPKR